MSFLEFLLIGAVIGFLVYCYFTWRYQRAFPENRPAMESAACGAGVIAGFHLVCCCFAPAELVHLTDENHRPLHTLELHTEVGGVKTAVVPHVEMDSLHALHILIGAFATVLVSLRGLIHFCAEVIPAKSVAPKIAPNIDPDSGSGILVGGEVD